MSYIIFLNPKILSATGMNVAAVFVATCLVSAFGSILCGIISDYPIAIAPGLVLSVYFTQVVAHHYAFSWQNTLGIVFIAGCIFFLISLTKIRYYIIQSIPICMTIGITVGIGIFIIFISLKTADIILPNQTTFITLNSLFQTKTLLFFLGFYIIIALDYFRMPGAIIISILIITFLSIILGISPFHGIISLPPNFSSTFLKLNLSGAVHQEGFPVIFNFLLIALFDSTGSLIGLLQQKEFLYDKNRPRQISLALLSESVSTMAGSLLGTSSTSPFIENAAGIKAGGRTGVTAIVVGLLFILSLFFSPLVESIPSCATAPALLYVGILMFKNIEFLNYEDFTDFVPALLTAIMIPFSFSVAAGFGIGLISYIVVKLFCGKKNSINGMLIILTLIFIGYFYLQSHS